MLSSGNFLAMKSNYLAAFLLVFAVGTASVKAADYAVKNGLQESAKPGDVIPVSEKDVRILARAAEILKDPSHWNRHDDRECPPTAVTFSLYCAMWKATEEVMGEFNHRQGALEELRRTVEEASTGKDYEHRLMGYNNDPATKLRDIQSVIKKTKMRIAGRLQPKSNTASENAAEAKKK
jgi:hypothetical protein